MIYDVTLMNENRIDGIKFLPGGNSRIEDVYGKPPFSLVETKQLGIHLTRKKASTLLKIRNQGQDEFVYIVSKFHAE